MFCRKCGAELSDDSAFCGKCGTPTSSNGNAQSSGGGNQKSASSRPSKSESRKRGEETLYELLGVSRSASKEEIAAAIKKERTVWSNRVSRGGTMGENARRKVEKIGEAESILLDVAKRKKYDASLETISAEEEREVVAEKNWIDEVHRYFDSGDKEMALQALERALPQHRDNAEAWFLAANVYLSVSRFDEANKAAMETILLNPGNPLAYGMRGDIMLAQRGDVSGALDMYTKMRERAKTADVQKYAEECIINAKTVVIAERCDKAIEPFSKSFSYDEAVMSRLNSAKSQVESCKQEVLALFNSESDPSAWLQQNKKELVDDMDRCSKEIQQCIDEGNEKVILNPLGFGLYIFTAVILGIIGIALCPYSVLFALVMFVWAACCAGVAFLKFRKPRYKIPQ